MSLIDFLQWVRVGFLACTAPPPTGVWPAEGLEPTPVFPFLAPLVIFGAAMLAGGWALLGWVRRSPPVQSYVALGLAAVFLGLVMGQSWYFAFTFDGGVLSAQYIMFAGRSVIYALVGLVLIGLSAVMLRFGKWRPGQAIVLGGMTLHLVLLFLAWAAAGLPELICAR